MRHKKTGKVDARVLGKRAHSNDPRLFKQKILPGKKDYFVLLMLDVSGSNIGESIILLKKAAFAQATLLDRLGIKFAVVAHSAYLHDPSYGRGYGNDMDIYWIKKPDERWTPEVQQNLLLIGPDAYNLDGHALEFGRKMLATRPENDKVLLYYSDGKMPAENHDEELEILQREIKRCRSKRYILLGVGIRTDSPRQHGLETVQVDSTEDVPKVIKVLEKHLARTKLTA